MCEEVVCEEVVCVSKLCVSKLCVSKLCGRRRREAEGGASAGVPNQNQDPHTKIWGKTVGLETLLEDEVGTTCTRP